MPACAVLERFLALLSISGLLAAVSAAEARAADVGEIALVPDDGTIISSALILDRYVQHAACAFYQTHADRYDALFIYTSAHLNALTRTQQGWPTRAAARGIGRDIYPDTTQRYCATRLRHAVKMGDIDAFTDDPDARYTGDPTFTLSGVQLMGHEFGHQWMAAVTFDAGDGRRRCLLRGFTPPEDGSGTAGDCDGYRNSDFNLHWSYYFNSGSVMYGNQIQDLGGGNFQLSNPDPKYSPLDQYLMGLRDPSEVPPMFVLDTGDLGGAQTTRFPLAATETEMATGSRVDFTVQDVIRAEGPRQPAREACHWKAAFVIVHPPMEPPSAQQIARVDIYRRRWEEFYDYATDRRGSFDTTLAGTGLGTSTCPAVEGADAGVPQLPDASPVDSGAAQPDAGTSSIPDAGETAEPDASAGTPEDAASQVTPPPMPPEGERFLKTADDCTCTEAAQARRTAGSPLAILALLVAVLRRPKHRRPSR